MSEANRVSDEVVKAYEEAALEGLRILKAYNAYQGTNPDYFRKARMNLAAISAYPKLYGAETNRMAVELAISERGARELPAAAEPKRLKAK
jgi:hypothetical protein